MAAPTHQDTRAGIIQLVRPAYDQGKPLAPDATHAAPSPPPKPQVNPSAARVKQRRPDWEAIQRLYEAGLLTLREIAATQNGTVTHQGIAKRAKTNDWARDLSSRIKVATDRKLNQAVADAYKVAKAVAKEEEAKETVDKKLPKSVAERHSEIVAIVSANAEKKEESDVVLIEAMSTAIMRVRFEHRTRINRFNAQLERMFLEVEASQSMLPELRVLGDLLEKPDERGIDKLNELYRKVLDFPGRTRALKDMADVLGTLIKLEREAWSLDTAPQDADGGRQSLPIRFVQAVERVEE